MIKCEKGTVSIKGPGNQILTEYAVITETIRESLTEHGWERKEAEEMVLKAAEIGAKNEEEIVEGPVKRMTESIIRRILGVDVNERDH